jgi:glycosyltransferase involved in cell wall biosynthesis
MYMGRFHQIKNLEALLAGFSCAGLPNARLVLVGRDEHAYSDRLADIAAAIPSTTVLAFDTVDKWRLLQSADIVVLPSLSENFGNVVLEALAIGKPVLVSNTTGTSALVAARRLGVVITPSVTGLSEGIRQIVADLPELSHNARLCASEIRRTYAWSTVAEQFAHLAALLLLDRSPLRKVT